MAISKRIGTPTNLPLGGTYDLLLFSFPDGYPEGKLTFAIGDNPKKITGIQKVAQLFIKLLMTRKGSDIIHPSLGTFFTDNVMGANRQSNDSDLQIQIISEVRDAESQCIYLLNNSTSDAASQVDKIVLLGLDTGSDSITMYLQLITLAGERAQIAVPFPQLDMVLSSSS